MDILYFLKIMKKTQMKISLFLVALAVKNGHTIRHTMESVDYRLSGTIL